LVDGSGCCLLRSVATLHHIAIVATKVKQAPSVGDRRAARRRFRGLCDSWLDCGCWLLLAPLFAYVDNGRLLGSSRRRSMRDTLGNRRLFGRCTGFCVSFDDLVAARGRGKRRCTFGNNVNVVVRAATTARKAKPGEHIEAVSTIY
jgi:hypothetical protein